MVPLARAPIVGAVVITTPIVILIIVLIVVTLGGGGWGYNRGGYGYRAWSPLGVLIVGLIILFIIGVL